MLNHLLVRGTAPGQQVTTSHSNPVLLPVITQGFDHASPAPHAPTPDPVLSHATQSLQYLEPGVVEQELL